MHRDDQGGGRGRGRGGRGGRGGKGGRGQNQPSPSEDIYKIVKLIKARSFQPVIVFSFNRRSVPFPVSVVALLSCLSRMCGSSASSDGQCLLQSHQTACTM